MIQRTWGTTPNTDTPGEVALDWKQEKGYLLALGTNQPSALFTTKASNDALKNPNFAELVQHIEVNASCKVYYINYSWNEQVYVMNTQTGYIVTDFVSQIIISPTSTNGASGQDILNSLTATIFEALQQAPFSNHAYAWETTAPTNGGTTPEPGGIWQISNLISEENKQKVIDWIVNKPETGIYQDPAGTPFQAAWISYRGVRVGMQDEDRFAPVNNFAYSPLTQEITDFQNVALVGILAALARTPDGREKIFRLAETYIKSTTSLLESIVESGKTHPLTALNASTAYAVTAHRFGIITDAGYLKMADQTRSIIDKLIQKDFLGLAIEGLSTFTDKAITVGQMATARR